jgi:NADPH-dependent curcumin reductase CurA
MSGYRKIEVQKLSPKFREATAIVEAEVCEPDDDEVVVAVEWVGINASDVNFTAGKYTPGVPPPFDAGFEALGKVVAAGKSARHLLHSSVLVSTFGAFSERLVVQAARAIPVPSSSPEMLPLLVSGLTAQIALTAVGNIKAGDTVLVTAAAGATGCFACQVAKRAGCRVIGTCSSQAKVELLRSLGVDRPINYRAENVRQVLKEEFPDGVDVVYESVGGEMFETAVSSLATHGRLIVIGFISGYSDGKGWAEDSSSKSSRDKTPLPVRLLAKSASVRGFFLNDFQRQWKRSITSLLTGWQSGQIRSMVDPHSAATFRGLEGVADAIDYMYERKNQGKVVVRLRDTPAAAAAASASSAARDSRL